MAALIKEKQEQKENNQKKGNAKMDIFDKKVLLVLERLEREGKIKKVVKKDGEHFYIRKERFLRKGNMPKK